MQHVHRLQPDDRGVGVHTVGVDERRQPKEHVEGHQHREGRCSSEFVHRLANAGDNSAVCIAEQRNDAGPQRQRRQEIGQEARRRVQWLTESTAEARRTYVPGRY